MKKKQKPKNAKNRRWAWSLGCGSFTLLEQLVASPTSPDAAMHRDRIRVARTSLEQMQRPETSTIAAWSVLCMVGNVLETMLVQNLAADPDGLLRDAFDCLRQATQAVRAPDDPVILPAANFPSVAGMVEDWAEILTTAPSRDVIRAMRATDARIKAIESGRLQPHDHAVITKHGHQARQEPAGGAE